MGMGLVGDYVLDYDASRRHTTYMQGKTHRVGKSVIEVAQVFASEQTCHDYLEAARWPKGVRCLQCGSDKISKYTAKGKTRIVKDKETGKQLTKIGPDRYLY